MAIYESERCDLCGCLLGSPDADTCPNCGADIHDVEIKVKDDRPVESFTLRMTPVETAAGEDRPAFLPEPWPELKRLAQVLDESRTAPDEAAKPGRMDVQNTLDMLTAGVLSMAGTGDPRCSVVNHFLRAIGHHLARTMTDLRDLEHHIRTVAPSFPSWLPGEVLAESIGHVRDSLQSVREDVQGPGDSLDGLPLWDVNVQPVKPAHALHRTVVVQAPDPLTARMVALGVAREKWPDTDFTAVSAVPNLDPVE